MEGPLSNEWGACEYNGTDYFPPISRTAKAKGDSGKGGGD